MCAAGTNLERLQFDAIVLNAEVDLCGPSNRFVTFELNLCPAQQDVGVITAMQKAVAGIGREVIQGKLYGDTPVSQQQGAVAHINAVYRNGKQLLQLIQSLG